MHGPLPAACAPPRPAGASGRVAGAGCMGARAMATAPCDPCACRCGSGNCGGWSRKLSSDPRDGATCAPSATWQAPATASTCRWCSAASATPLAGCPACARAAASVSTKLDEIYNTWFARRPEAVRLYPATQRRPAAGGWRESARLRGLRQSAGSGDKCLHRLRASRARRRCSARRARGRRYSRQRAVHLARRHVSGVRRARRQLLLGARNATLGSQVVEQSWASGFNDDKKLIAFSDSVQDAAHRAGFFGARTYAEHRPHRPGAGDRPARNVRACPGPQFLAGSRKRCRRAGLAAAHAAEDARRRVHRRPT